MHYPWLHLGFYHYVLSSYALMQALFSCYLSSLESPSWKTFLVMIQKSISHKKSKFSEEKKKMKKNLHNKQKGMLKDKRQRASLLAQ